MSRFYKSNILCFKWLAAASVATVLYSCASMSMPSGGARDEDPPRIVGTSPRQGSTQMQGRRVYLDFDELVSVKDAFTNVVVSPPQAHVPKVRASGRRIIVEWDEDLLPDTTYTIDFGDAIEDLNEANKLGQYSFSFSTGSSIDTLRISGMVLEASNLEPRPGVLVGVHSAEAPDSAFRTLRFERVTKTDERGRFTLRGLKSKPYKLFALEDLNNDYRWDNPAELIAFYPKSITPYATSELTTDTIFNMLTGKPDTTINRLRTKFMPDNLLLSLFDTGYKTQYLVKYERPDSARLSFIFNAPAAALPSITFPGRAASEDWALVEHSLKNDTVTYWLTDRNLINSDTLKVALGYMRSDTQRNLISDTDTLTFTKPKARVAQNKKRTKQQMVADSIAAEKAKWIDIALLPSGNVDVYAPLIIETPEPLLSLDKDKIHLEIKQDTLYNKVNAFELSADSTGQIRRYKLKHPWEYGSTYRLTVDSLALSGTSGRPNSTFTREFTIKKREDYASLTLRLSPGDVQGFVEVLNSSDTPVARVRVENGVARFPYLAPMDYYARFIKQDVQPADSLSSQGIMEFHTGDYDTARQPDDVYYFPKMLSLKRHDRSEQWDLNATAVDAQKPDAIKKNKPKKKSVATKKKQVNGANGNSAEGEDDDYFDVSNNPFDPKGNSRNRTRR